jgi:hypothetical protein
MQSLRRNVLLAGAIGVLALMAGACSDQTSSPGSPFSGPTSCAGISVDPQPAKTSPLTLPVLGVGRDTVRYSAEITVRGTLAYTSTWSVRQVQGNKINIWDVSGSCPQLVDSVIVNGVTTTGDIAISDDGKTLVVATEHTGGSIVTYDLTDPRHPQLLTRFLNDQTMPGVHTAELGRVNGTLYAFLCVDPSGASFPARLVIVDLSTPAAPRQVYVKQTGSPYVHDTYQRDGLLFVALWNDGMDIWDIGGGGRGGTPAAPVVLGNVKTVGGEVHNVWWYHDASGAKKYAFVGEEGSGTIGSTSRGDIHVVDVSDMSKPREVAFYHVDGAGTHNFSVDEANGVLYAAYYNGGVRAIDVRGDLGSCTASQQVFDAGSGVTRCDLKAMGRELGVGLAELNRGVYVWGVQYLNGNVYASDMINGIWKLGAAK